MGNIAHSDLSVSHPQPLSGWSVQGRSWALLEGAAATHLLFWFQHFTVLYYFSFPSFAVPFLWYSKDSLLFQTTQGGVSSSTTLSEILQCNLRHVYVKASMGLLPRKMCVTGVGNIFLQNFWIPSPKFSSYGPCWTELGALCKTTSEWKVPYQCTTKF